MQSSAHGYPSSPVAQATLFYLLPSDHMVALFSGARIRSRFNVRPFDAGPGNPRLCDPVRATRPVHSAAGGCLSRFARARTSRRLLGCPLHRVRCCKHRASLRPRQSYRGTHPLFHTQRSGQNACSRKEATVLTSGESPDHSCLGPPKLRPIMLANKFLRVACKRTVRHEPRTASGLRRAGTPHTIELRQA